MQLDLLNAAVITVYLQLGMRGKPKFWRTWNIYFPMVLAAARSLSLFSTRKADIENCSPSFLASWDLWVKMERMIRTGFSIFLLDGQVSILFRTTPKINLDEMMLDIPSREAAFRARTCEDWILMDPFPVDPPASSFAAFMQQLIAGSDMDISESAAEAIPFSGLLFAICAFHNLIFLSQANPLYQKEEQSPLLRPLAKWKRLWDMKHSQGEPWNATELAASQLGDSYHWLARLLLKYEPCMFHDGFGHDSLDALGKFVTLYRNEAFA
ncbi:hypothetical protein ACHAPT_008132 [Fusarium lateritium]